MKTTVSWLKNILLTIAIPIPFFALSIFVQGYFDANALIPMLFVLAVFLTTLTTKSLPCGLCSSVICVLAVNYAFTFPYFAFNFLIPVNLFSTLVMLCVSLLTSMLTTKIRTQDQLHMETEKELIRANLLRAVSHDLRTPLTTIYGSSSAIMENYDQLTDEQKLKLLGEISEDARWLTGMVENLLSITRVGGDDVALSKSPTVLEELIDTVLIKFKKRYPQQSVQVDIPDQFIIIPMDAMLITQVIVNLLENSVQHAVGMTKLCLQVSTQGMEAIFEIADNGCGVPQNKLGELFTGYSQHSDSADQAETRGMGIGLSVCAAIIKAHGGKIQAENNAQHGLTIRFSMEVEEAHE